MSTEKHPPRNGVGLLTVLQIIFIVLKCLNLISWSWAMVFIPFYIGFGIMIFLAFIFGVILLVDHLS